MAICYEVIFPNLVRQFAVNGAEFLVTVTNDAWFGSSSAASQHYSMVVFRSVENHLAFARSANTGISGFIDPFGRIVEATPIFTEQAVKATQTFIKLPPEQVDRIRDQILTASSTRIYLQTGISTVVADENCKLKGKEGPCEAALCRLKDGRLMGVFRMDSGAPYGQVWSSDEGSLTSPPGGAAIVQKGIDLASSVLTVANGVIDSACGLIPEGGAAVCSMLITRTLAITRT